MRPAKLAILPALLLYVSSGAIELAPTVDIDNAKLPKLFALMGEQPKAIFAAYGHPTKIFDACSNEPGCVGYGYGSFDLLAHLEGVYMIRLYSTSVSISGVRPNDAADEAMKKWGAKETKSYTDGTKYFTLRDSSFIYSAVLKGDNASIEYIIVEQAGALLDPTSLRKVLSLLDESGSKILTTLGYPRKIADGCTGDASCVDFDYGSYDLYLRKNKVYKVMFWNKELDFYGVSIGTSLKDVQRAWSNTEVKAFNDGRKYITRREGQILYVAVMDKDGVKVSYFQAEYSN